MKRLVRYPVYASETVEAGMLETAAKLLKTLFRNLDNTFDTISSWIDVDKDSESADAPAAPVKDHLTLEVMPSGDDEDWETGPSCRVLVKNLDEDDDYVVVRFDMKSNDGSATDTDTATIKKKEDDESDEASIARAQKMLYDMIEKMLRRCLKDDNAEISEIREVG